MNKTVTINISGIIFYIEEQAYEKLSLYLATIRSYFNQSEGRDEIMADIESRIAELLQEKITPVKQVVLLADVNDVINLMGKPEEFAGESANTGTKADYTYAEQQTYSDEGSAKKGRRRVFRDPDDRVLGGVCSGIAAYFGMDPLWLRILLAISLFFFGFGLLFYILLWIIIPQARTTAEKLEMRGERVDINNISKTINEELEHLKKKMNDLRDEASTIGSKDNRDRVQTSINKFVDFIVSILGNLLTAVIKFFIIILVAITIIILVFFLGSLFGGADFIHINNNGNEFSYSLNEFINTIFNTPFQAKMALIGVVLLLGIPLIMMIYGGIKYVLNIKRQNHPSLKIGTRVLWFAGLALVIYSLYNLQQDFAQTGISKQKMAIMQPKSDTLYLKVLKEEFYEEHESHSKIMIGKVRIFKANGETVSFGWPEMDIVASETDSFQLLVIKTARSGDKKEAFNRAKKINYTFSQQDSLIEFNSYFDMPRNEKWRNQNVKLLLKVPENKVIYLSKSMKDIIYDIDNVSDTYDEDMVGKKWIMTDEGLACLDCDGGSRYNHSSKTSKENK